MAGLKKPFGRPYLNVPVLPQLGHLISKGRGFSTTVNLCLHFGHAMVFVFAPAGLGVAGAVVPSTSSNGDTAGLAAAGGLVGLGGATGLAGGSLAATVGAGPGMSSSAGAGVGGAVLAPTRPFLPHLGHWISVTRPSIFV